jgi:hypothetical protein
MTFGWDCGAVEGVGCDASSRINSPEMTCAAIKCCTAGELPSSPLTGCSGLLASVP